MWALIVKLNGIILIRFIVIREINNAIRILSVNLRFLLDRMGLVSFLIDRIKNFIMFEILLLLIKVSSMIISGIIEIAQFSFKVDDDGSNIENRFVIIFI